MRTRARPALGSAFLSVLIAVHLAVSPHAAAQPTTDSMAIASTPDASDEGFTWRTPVGLAAFLLGYLPVAALGVLGELAGTSGAAWMTVPASGPFLAVAATGNSTRDDWALAVGAAVLQGGGLALLISDRW